MINIIKTAIITIIISFASGLLLDYFTNLGPRILCNVRSVIPKGMNIKENSAYIITVKNPSKKTIHELTINIQSSQRNLKSTDFKITNGLKFDSSINDNILEVYIPFLSKGDDFSVTVCAENQSAVHSKPVIVIRSPENFKEIDSSDQNGILTALFNIPKNIKQVMHKVTGSQQPINKENRDVMPPNKNKKAIIIIVLIVLVVIAGVSIKFYSKGATTNASTSTVKTSVPKQSSGAEGSAGTNGTTGTEGGANGTNGTSGEGSNAPTVPKAGSGGANATSGASSAGSSRTPATNAASAGAANSTTGTNSSGAGVTNSTTGSGSTVTNGTSGGASGAGAAGTATNAATGTSGAANGTTAK